MEQSKGRMSAKERWEALLSRQPVDRVPFFPLGNNLLCCQNMGYAVLGQYADMKKHFESQRKIPEH